MPWWYVRIIKKSNPNLNYMHFETHLTMNLTRFFQLLAIFAALKCYHREYGKEKWHSFLPDVCPCEFVFIRFLDFEVWRHRQPHTTILRYESSTPTSQELSSPIFQSLWECESGIGVIWPDLHFSQYFKAYQHYADPVPSRINRYHFILTQYQQVPTIAVL